MPRLIYAFVVHICNKQFFSWYGSYNFMNMTTSVEPPVGHHTTRKIQRVDSVNLNFLRQFRKKLVGWLCWGLTSQSTIFQSCRDGAIASWVINQYFRGVKCLAQGHNTEAVGFEPQTSRSGVRHSTTEPPRSPPQKVMTFRLPWLCVSCL